MKLTATGVIHEGKISLDDMRAYRDDMKRFGEGESIVVTVESVKEHRTTAQNRRYWKILSLLSDHTGHHAEELHEYFKPRFLPKHVVLTDASGIVIDDRVVGGTTTTLSTREFSDYCDRIIQFAAEELGFVVLDPGERAA